MSLNIWEPESRAVSPAEQAVQEAVAAEREACARLAEDWALDRHDIAYAIRARNESRSAG